MPRYRTELPPRVEDTIRRLVGADGDAHDGTISDDRVLPHVAAYLRRRASAQGKTLDATASEAAARAALRTYMRAYSAPSGPAAQVGYETPAWVREIGDTLESMGEVPEAQRGADWRAPLLRVLREQEAERGLPREQILDAWQRWEEAHHDLIERIHGYMEACHERMQAAWKTLPEGTRMGELFASGALAQQGLGTPGDWLALARRHGLVPAPDCEAVWPGRWLRADEEG
jgi:hypothetical protein